MVNSFFNTSLRAGRAMQLILSRVSIRADIRTSCIVDENVRRT